MTQIPISSDQAGGISEGGTGGAGGGGLTRVLASVRRHARLVWLVATTLGVTGSFGLLLVIGLMLDHYLVLSALPRLLLLLVVVGAPLLLLRIAWRRRPGQSLAATALLIEQQFGGLDNILINSLQLSNEAELADNAFVGEVAGEAEQRLRSISARAAVRKWWLTCALVTAMIGGGIIAQQAKSNPDQLTAGINRVFAPFGDNTFTRIVEVSPGDLDILIHSDVEVAAMLEGRVPTQADLECTLGEDPAVNVTMAAASEAVPDRLVAMLENIEQDMTYRVTAGDDRSQAFTIRVHERPVIERITQTIAPPRYIGTKNEEKLGGTIRALAGSQVQLRVSASEPLRDATLVLNDSKQLPLHRVSAAGSALTAGTLAMHVTKRGRYRLELISDLGFASEPAAYNIIVLEDRPPKVKFVQPRADLAVDIDAQVVIEIEARDNYAVRALRLVRADDAQAPPLSQWVQKTRDRTSFKQQVTLSVADLGLAEDKPIVLKALAYDFRPDGEPGVSDPLTITLKALATPSEKSSADADQRVSLGELITLQRENLTETQTLLTERTADQLTAVQRRQERIHKATLALAENEAADSPAVKQQLVNLAETLMVLAIEQLRRVQLPAAAKTEKAILDALIGAEADQNEEGTAKQVRQIAEMLAELIGKQKALKQDTQKKTSTGAALSARQRVLSRRFAALVRIIGNEAKTGAGGNDDLAAQLKQILAIFDEQKVRSTMLIAAERLGKNTFDTAIKAEDKVLSALLAAQAILNKAALQDAKEELDELKENLEDAKDRVDKMTELQQNVTEIAQQLNETKDRRDGREDEFDHAAELDEVREDVEDAIEELITDMHLFPPTDISNDLLSEMSEIFEDIKQKTGSEDEEITEVAVDRDEGLLAALKEMQKKMEERLGDVEMWLPDVPDQIRWKQESYDKNEMGEIPLGDLPDELEDIVGDLTEQAEQLTEEAQDAASNVGLPDMTMGWDIVDGPMPSWAAKGKSGNQRPNTNEMIGRSGSGRQGQSSGEVVGDTLKALEGSAVKTRRTEDPFQAGELMEEDPSFMDVKATGGGKLAGITNTEGMMGNAPARDVLKYRQLQRSHQMLKRNAQSIYTKAKLLRLPTGEMDRALLEMDAAQRRLESGDISGYLRSQQEVVRSLKKTHGRLTGKVVIDESASAAMNATAGATGEPIPRQYEDAVADYMRHIAEKP